MVCGLKFSSWSNLASSFRFPCSSPWVAVSVCSPAISHHVCAHRAIHSLCVLTAISQWLGPGQMLMAESARGDWAVDVSLVKQDYPSLAIGHREEGGGKTQKHFSEPLA